MNRREPRLTTTVSQEPNRNYNWMQIERSALTPIADLIRKDAQAARLLMMLMKLLEPHKENVIVASRKTLCELAGFSESSFHRAMKPLIRDGWIHRLRIGNAYAFAFNGNIAWIGPREGIRNAQFSARVIATSTEQDRHALEPPEAHHMETAVTFATINQAGAD